MRKFGTILTVERYKKQFTWHVSVTLLDTKDWATPIARLTETDKAVVLRLARELLHEVGRPGSDRIHEDEKSVHIIRQLTIEEERAARRACHNQAS